MSRDIKFRAWHPSEKRWHYFELADLIIGRAGVSNIHYQDWCEYTGFKDKNGVEIYEGDVLSSAIWFRAHPYEISFRKGSFVGKQMDEWYFGYYMLMELIDEWCFGYHMLMELIDERNSPEVIGNIYE